MSCKPFNHSRNPLCVIFPSKYVNLWRVAYTQTLVTWYPITLHKLHYSHWYPTHRSLWCLDLSSHKPHATSLHSYNHVCWVWDLEWEATFLILYSDISCNSYMGSSFAAQELSNDTMIRLCVEWGITTWQWYLLVVNCFPTLWACLHWSQRLPK